MNGQPFPHTHHSEPIAIIGMGCRFPGRPGKPANTPAAFWELLHSGVDIRREVPASRWDMDALYDPRPDMPGKVYVRQGYFLDDESFDHFDARFFGLAAREIAAMDPQQRLLLETSWEALEAAAIAPESIAGSQTGVFISSFWDDYTGGHLYGGDRQAIDRYTVLSNLRPMAAGRLAHLLGVHGPNLQVDTACSASLTALHLACQSLRQRECDLAFAGGVYLMLTPEILIGLCQMGALAPDGRSKAFDRSADGFAIGEGCGMVLLKRLADAQADGDPICAVIRGSALNHDGHSRTVTTPNGQAQRHLLRQALAQAGVNPTDVDYLEAHGTGTELGDPIEVLAIADAYCQQRAETLLIGSVKSNVGHLNAAAGIAGLFKVVLALQNGEIPPSLHINQLNPRIPWQKLGMAVPTAPTPWPAQDRPRSAGLSAFGLSGSNAHVIVEEAPRAEEIGRLGDWEIGEGQAQLFVLSAKSEEGLRAYAQRYDAFLAAHPKVNLADLCYTAQSGRSHFPHRLGVAAASVEQLQEALRTFAQGQPQTAVSQAVAPVTGKGGKIAFLFTGQGAQYVGMGRNLYESEPVFRATLDECDALLRPLLGQSILPVMGVGTGESTTPRSPIPDPRSPILDNTAYTQPALFALEYALAQLWQSWGVQPDLLLGHSIGELAAACMAGVFSLADALKLVAARGRLMAALPQDGEMLSLLASEEQAMAAIAPYAAEVSIAAVNAPRSVVISGRQEAVLAIGEELAAQGVKTRRLTVSHAFHSPLMEPMLDEFRRVAESIAYHPPRLRLVSNLTGQVAGPEIATPDYWVRHARQAVRFADGVQTLAAEGCQLFVEIGPQSTLLGLVGQTLDSGTGDRGLRTGNAPVPLLPPHPVTPSSALLPSLRQGQPDRQQMLASLSELYVRGVKIDWTVLHRDASRRKISLPTYPFQRQRYWVNPPSPRKGEGLRPLIDQITRSPAIREIIGQTTFSLARLPFLGDHRVNEAIVSPGACQLAMALSVVELALHREQGLHLADVALPQPLLLGEENLAERTAQVILTPTPAHERTPVYDLRLLSFAPGSDEPESATHLLGKASASNETAPSPVDLAALRRGWDHPVDPNLLYSRLAEAGVALGPSFRWIRALWKREGSGNGGGGSDGVKPILTPQASRLELLAELVGPEALGTTTGHLLHPGLLDSCFQVAGAAAILDGTIAAPLLPFAAESLHLHHRATGERWWCHARQREDARWEIRLLDEQGDEVVSIAGFELREAQIGAMQPQTVWRKWLYDLTWQPQPLAHPSYPLDGQRWLILADRQGVGETLAARLQGLAALPLLVYADSDQGEKMISIGQGRWAINPARPDHFVRVLSEAIALGAVDGVVHLWSLDTPPLVDQPVSASLVLPGCGGGLHLLQALLRTGQEPAVLLFVTKDAQAILPDDRVTGLAQAALWGLGKTVALEHPELNCALVDLSAEDEKTGATIWAGQLLEEIACILQPATKERERQIGWRTVGDGRNRYVARLHPAHLADEPLQVRPDAAYLITGGMGGLGLAIARWFVSQGAGYLLLLGRSQPSPTAQRQLDELRGLGARVITAQADVAELEQLKQALTLLDPARPLVGVVHAAGVLDDGALLQQSWERFAGVMPAKMAGVWHLHQLTLGLPLDFFVCFSSTASLLGNAGQVNYAAANAFLDAFAHARRAEGLPYLSINWGGWAEVGKAAQLSAPQQEAMLRRGEGSISPAQGVEIFAHVSASRRGQIGVLPVHWSRYLSQSGYRHPFFSELEAYPTASSPALPLAQTDGLRQQLAAVAEAERASLLLDVLEKYTARILGLADGVRLDPTTGLMQAGFDSLMAVELRNHLGKSLELNLPATLVFDYPTLHKLRDTLLERLETHTTGVLASPIQSADESQRDARIRDDIDLLTDDELMAQIDAAFARRS